MILINPLSGVGAVDYVYANNLYDYDVNLAFANKIKKYISKNDDEVILTRTTNVALTADGLTNIISSNAPDVIINIKCISDVDTVPSGYTVECDSYTALAATLASAMYRAGRSPVYPSGYKINSVTKLARYTDITIGIGYITNVDEAAYLAIDANLDTLAEVLIEAAYGPPVKALQSTDEVYVPDPYMYDVTKWEEVESSRLIGDIGALGQIKIEDIPIKVLHIETGDIFRIDPYIWRTDIIIPGYLQSYKVILTLRVLSIGASVYIKVGNVTQTLTYDDISWHKITFDYVYNEGDEVELGAFEDAIVEFTAVWVAPYSTIGVLDDPLTKYSIYPPGYRDVSSIDPTNVDTALIPNAITQANSLISRAQDGVASSSSVVSSALSAADTTAISPTSFTSSFKAITNQMSNLSLTAVKVINPSTVKVNYSMLTNMAASMSKNSKRADLLNSINSMKGVESSITSLTKTTDTKVAEATALADKIKKRKEVQGEAMANA